MKKASTGSRWTNRPNGMQPAYYKLGDWLKKRIVWEFVRRNVKYQKACDSAMLDQRTDEIDGPPSEYGSSIPLRDLVDYTRDWGEAQALLHFFVPRARLEDAEDTDCDPKRYLKLVLDIHKLVLNPWMLDERMGEIKKLTKKRMEKYADQAGREIVVPRFHSEVVARSLRYLDMVAAGTSSKAIKHALFPDKSPEDQDRMLDKEKKRALKYRKGHVAFLLLEVIAEEQENLGPTAKKAA